MESKNYSDLRKPTLPLLAALCLPFLCAPALPAQGSGYLSVNPPEKIVAKRGATVPLKLPVSIVPGYHVNSNKPTESYLIPLSIKWTPGPIEAGETVFPKPGMEKYEFSKTPLSVFTGNFALQTTLKATASVPVGPATLSGKLRYQACNDKACFPPKTIEVNIPVQVQ